MDNNLSQLKTEYDVCRGSFLNRPRDFLYASVAYVEALEQELEKVLGSPTLRLAAEVARARQAEINRLRDFIEMSKRERRPNS
jgi:hypothetical protein